MVVSSLVSTKNHKVFILHPICSTKHDWKHSSLLRINPNNRSLIIEFIIPTFHRKGMNTSLYLPANIYYLH